MPIVLIVVVLLVALPALWLGGRNVRSWSSQQDPLARRDVAGEMTVTALRIGLLILLLAVAAVAVVGSAAAFHGDAPIPGGVIVAAVAAVIIGALVIMTFGRRKLTASGT